MKAFLKANLTWLALGVALGVAMVSGFAWRVWHRISGAERRGIALPRVQ